MGAARTRGEYGLGAGNPSTPAPGLGTWFRAGEEVAERGRAWAPRVGVATTCGRGHHVWAQTWRDSGTQPRNRLNGTAAGTRGRWGEGLA